MTIKKKKHIFDPHHGRWLTALVKTLWEPGITLLPTTSNGDITPGYPLVDGYNNGCYQPFPNQPFPNGAVLLFYLHYIYIIHGKVVFIK